ncbi:hypothetical protein L6164_005735 [Bauhinia variegata]|uniref:Uncharacterized protein n=1 Tax=Bauhinia variegata TaxID=167791 RepID=A0ACB9PUB3_BAUVA|nr:hypothetical protein L6164_005735 [Bauhinia variegata]
MNVNNSKNNQVPTSDQTKRPSVICNYRKKTENAESSQEVTAATVPQILNDKISQLVHLRNQFKTVDLSTLLLLQLLQAPSMKRDLVLGKRYGDYIFSSKVLPILQSP